MDARRRSPLLHVAFNSIFLLTRRRPQSLPNKRRAIQFRRLQSLRQSNHRLASGKRPSRDTCRRPFELASNSLRTRFALALHSLRVIVLIVLSFCSCFGSVVRRTHRAVAVLNRAFHGEFQK